MARPRRIPLEHNEDVTLNLESTSEKTEQDQTQKQARIERYQASNIPYCEQCGWQLRTDPVNGVNICPIALDGCNRNKTPILE